MRTRSWASTIFACGLAATLALPALGSSPLTNAFTYQGRLNDGGVPGNGTYDFIFRLFDSAVNGLQVGPDVAVGGLPVTDGLFTAQLDFGSAYSGNALWLEILVRPSVGGSGYTSLTPRQSLTAAPFALYALNDANWQANGSAITNRNSGFVGINRSTPLTGVEAFGIQSHATSNSYGGMYLATDGPSAKPFYGYSSGSSKSCWTYLDGNTGDWRVNNSGDRLIVTNTGQVGVGVGFVGATYQMHVSAISGNITALVADATGANSTGILGYGDDTGIEGHATAANGTGVYGISLGFPGSTTGDGVYGYSDSTNGAGVNGYDPNGHGVEGGTNIGVGVYGNSQSGTGYAGYFNGKVYVNGNLAKAAGSFKIDHPLDPANKYLYHSFVESPDMKNIYDGVITTDEQGLATVTMPDWFMALNADYRYQLTVVGQFAQAIIGEKLHDGRFVIRTDKPNVEVSWQVTGIRIDPYAQAHRIPTEEAKPASERGLYLHPELYGADPTQSVDPAVRAGPRPVKLVRSTPEKQAAGN